MMTLEIPQPRISKSQKRALRMKFVGRVGRPDLLVFFDDGTEQLFPFAKVSAFVEELRAERAARK